MSWLSISDFAKTALTDVQKRIDKVLDIQEDGVGGGAVETSKDGKAEQIKTSPPSSVKSPSSSKHPQTSTPRKNLTQKKKNKPSKLGSSLTKKTPPSLPQSPIISESLKVPPQPFDAPEEGEKKQDELELPVVTVDDNDHVATSEDHFSSSTTSVQLAAETSPCDTTAVHDGSDLLNETSGVIMKETVEEPSLHPENKDEDEVDKNATLSTTMELNEDVKQQGEDRDRKTSRSDSDSAPVSTSASSDIDILDHESEISEISFVSKGQQELDGSMMQFCAIDNQLSNRISTAGNNEWNDSEASDIVAYSGYCSPVSVEGYDGHGHVSPVNFTKPSSATSMEMEMELSSELTICSSSTSIISSSTIATSTQPPPILDPNPIKVSSNDDEGGDVITSYDVDTSSNNQQQEEHDDDNLDVTQESPPQKQVPDVGDDVTQVEAEADKNPTDESQEELPPSSGEDEMKLQIYEQQLMTLSLNNARLNEDNDNLRSEVEALKMEIRPNLVEENESLLQTIEELKINLKQLKTGKEKDEQEIYDLKKEVSMRMSHEEIQAIISEKEESIRGLLQEGEQLSKKEHQQNMLIKKLRGKVNEKEENTKDLNDKLAKIQKENESMKQKLEELQAKNKSENERNSRVVEAYQERENEINEARNQLEDCEEKLRAAQSTLDAAYKDVAEMNKKVATLESEKQKAVEKCEEENVKRLLTEKDEIEKTYKERVDLLNGQINEMRTQVERNDDQSAHREQILQKEIMDIRKRLQESEMRNYELTESISESTRPLIRQMENLQITHSNQSKTWELVEKSLTSRLDDAQLQLATAQEREHHAQTTMKEAKKNVRKLEEQLNAVKSERSSLQEEISKLKETSQTYGEQVNSLKRELLGKEESFESTMSKLRREKIQLENQVDNEKLKSENERKKLQQHIDIITKEKERLLWINRQDSITSASMLNGDVESIASSNDQTIDSSQDRHLSTTNSLIYDNLIRNSTSTSSVMENLQSQLKMREGEITQLQGEINILERTRSSMAEEIVRLTNENEEFETTKGDLITVTEQLKEMRGRHDGILMMYGEKAEENEELKMDLEDVKQMYRQQIDALLSNPGR